MEFISHSINSDLFAQDRVAVIVEEISTTVSDFKNLESVLTILGWSS